MEQEIDKEFQVKLIVKKKSFVSTVKSQSEIHRILSNANLSTFDGFEMHLLPKEEIDDLDFEKVVFLFEMQKLVQNSMKHIIIKSEAGNYLTPLTFCKVLQPFSNNAKSLFVFVADHCGKSINEWLSRFERLISTFNLEQLYFQVEPYFCISLIHGQFSANIKSGVTQNEDSLQHTANICGKFNITSFRLKIGDDNIVKSGVDNFAPYLNKQQIKSFNINIGQSCQINPSSVAFILQNICQLEELKIKIGNSNQLNPDMLVYIIQQVQRGLKVLKLNLGSSTKVFSSSLPLDLGTNTLKTLIFRIGKMNNFQFGGANLLAHLANSNILEVVKISIGDFNQMTELQSLQIFLLLQRLRNVKQLELSFERNICVNNLCITQLEKLIEKNCNLTSLTLNFLKQQEQLKFDSLFSLLGQKKNLINLDLSFGGLQTLPDLIQFGVLLSQLQYLSAFQLNLKGNNNVQYDKLRIFLKKIKSNKNLNLLTLKTGSQQSSEYREQEFIENAIIIRDVLLVDKPIVINFNHLNEQLCYQFNFDRLFLNAIPQVFSRQIKFPHPSNQIKINIERECLIETYIEKIGQLIGDQEEIDIKIGNLKFICNKSQSSLTTRKFQEVQLFLYHTTKCIQEVQTLEIGYTLNLVAQVIFNLIERVKEVGIGYLKISFRPVTIILENQKLQISINHENENNPQAFTHLCSIINQLSQFSITHLKIEFNIFNFSQNWGEFKQSLQDYCDLQDLDLKFRNQTLNQGTCQDYRDFHLNMLDIFVNNLNLINYDYFHEQRVFPVQLQLHLGQEIKTLEENIKIMEQQQGRIQNGNPIDGDQNVQLDELEMRLQNSRQDLQMRNTCIEQGKKIEDYKRQILLSRQKVVNQYYIALLKYKKRNYKQLVLSDILEMLI